MALDFGALTEGGYITDDTALFLIKKAGLALTGGGGALHTRKRGIKVEDCKTLVVRTFTEDQLKHFREVIPCGVLEPATA